MTIEQPTTVQRARWAAIAARNETRRRLTHVRLGRRTPRRDLSSLAVVAALRSNNGIARGAVMQHHALQAQGRRVQLVDATPTRRARDAGPVHEPATAYVFHCGAPETSQLIHRVLPQASQAWRIGYWAWELPDPPPAWRRHSGLVSEVWAPSRFAAESLTKIFPGPVLVVPHQVDTQPLRVREPGTPFTVLVMADSRSSFTRKNPMAAVEAFRRAFGDSPDARLVVKLNGNRREVDRLVRSLRLPRSATVVADFLDRSALDELLRSADTLLSLHRSEGFGLPMLEAMAHGVPVVGTGWSGNTDFMDEDNSLLVPYRLVPVTDPAGIYSNSIWAEPDVDAAADLLRQLAGDEELHSRLAKAAHEFVASTGPTLPA